MINIIHIISKRIKGFALIEILIAVAIISIVLLSVYSGVSTSINVLSGTKNYSKAMIIAKSKLNEFRMEKMRGMDVNHEPVDEYPGFFHSRTTERFEHVLFGPLPASRTEVTISWTEKKQEMDYSISYIYPTK